MKPKLILQSLADIPADALSLAVSMPRGAVNASDRVPGPAVRLTRREIRAARRDSAAFARDLYVQANAPLQSITPWQCGGINE